MSKDLSGFINHVKELYPDDVLEIKRTVDPQNYQATAILEHLDREKRFPLVHFKSALNLLGEVSECSLVSNVFGTRERCATVLDFARDHSNMPLSLEFARRELNKIDAKTVANDIAPVREVVDVGEQVDLRQLPIVRHFEMDLGPYTTMACVLRDPDEGFYDVSFVKWVYKGPRKAGVVLHSPHFVRLLKKYEERGQAVPIINVLGHHPAFYLGSLALAPWGTNDYDLIGSFMGEPLRLTPSQTWGSDFLVPADAEIIVEGEMPPGVREIVNPFGEYTRLYQAQTLRPVANVTAVTRRRQAILQDVFSGHQGHFILGGLPKEGGIFNAIKRKFDGVKAVHMPYSGSSRSTCYISIKKQDQAQVMMAAEEALAQSRQIHGVVIVDDDIDVFNETDVIWAMITWSDPRRSATIIERADTSRIVGPRTVIDATRPLGVALPERIRVPESAMSEIKLSEWIPI